MRKRNILILLNVLFLSCSMQVEFSYDKLTYLGKIDYLNYDKIFFNRESQDLLLWKDFKILKRSLLSNKDEWEFFSEFKPDNFFIEKEDSDKLLIPQSIEDIKYTSDKKFSAFVLRFGNSMNTTIGLMDLSLNKIIFSYRLKEHPPAPGRRFEFLAFENVYTNPVFSDGDRFLACDVFNYLNKRKIRILDISKQKYKDIEDAVFPCFQNEKLYFIDIDNKAKKTYISSFDIISEKKYRIKEMGEYVLLFKKTKNNIFLVTKNNIYYFDSEQKDIVNIMTFTKIKNNIKNSEIMRVFIENYNNEDYLFLILKILEKNQYIWKLYGKILKIKKL